MSRHACTRTLRAGVLAAALFLPASARAEDDLTPWFERELAQARRRTADWERGFDRQPAALQEPWRRILGAMRKETEHLEKGLNAAKDRDWELARSAQTTAGNWMRRRSGLEWILNLERQAIQWRQPDAEEGAQEQAVRKRLQEQCEAMRALGARLAADAGDLDRGAIETLCREANERSRLCWFDQRLLALWVERRELTRRRDGEQNEVLRGLWAERVGLQDRQLALAEERRQQGERPDANAATQSAQREAEVQKAIADWHGRLRAAEANQRFEREFAQAPPALKPLLREVLDLNLEAEKLRAPGGDEVEARRRLREARAEALREKANALEQLVDVRKELAQVETEFGETKDEPELQARRRRVLDLLARTEQKVRARAELVMAARLLEARAEAAEEEERGMLNRTEDAIRDFREMLETARQRREELGALAKPKAGREFAARLQEELNQLEKSAAGKPDSAAYAALVRGVWREALEAVRQGMELAEKDREASVAEFTKAMERETLAAKLQPRLLQQLRFEELALNFGGKIPEPMRTWLADARRNGEEAAKLEIAAAQLAAGGGAADAVVEALVKCGEAAARADRSLGELRRSLQPPAVPPVERRPPEETRPPAAPEF